MAVPDTLPEVLTVEEFERLEDPPGYRLELVGGMLVGEPQPGALHGLVTMNALRALDTHCRAHRSGMVFVEELSGKGRAQASEGADVGVHLDGAQGGPPRDLFLLRWKAHALQLRSPAGDAFSRPRHRHEGSSRLQPLDGHCTRHPSYLPVPHVGTDTTARGGAFARHSLSHARANMG